MAETNYKELKNSISKNQISPVYLLCGDSEMVTYFEKLITTAVLGEKYNDFNFSILNGENISLYDLSNSLETFPVASSKKCVLMKNISWEKYDSESMDKLIKIVNDIPDFCVLIVSVPNINSLEKGLANFKKLQKFAAKKGTVANFSSNDISLTTQLQQWAKNNYGKILPPEIAKKIESLCKDYSISEIKNELKKICEFETSETISEESLIVVYKSVPKVKIFELPKALFAKKVYTCFKITDSLINQKTEPYTILAIIASEYTDIYRVKTFLKHQKKPSELKDFFDYKNKEFRIKNAETRCKNLSSEQINQSLKCIMDADVKLKSTLCSATTVLYELMVSLINLL